MIKTTGELLGHDWDTTANDEDALRVVMQAVVTMPLKAGPRKVCVRVVDVSGSRRNS